MPEIPSIRETWFVKNVSTQNITISDIPAIPVIRPGQRVNLLLYATSSVVSRSLVLSGYINKGLIVPDKYLHTHDDKANVVDLNTHISKTKSVHGIADTSKLDTLIAGPTSNADDLHTHVGIGGGGGGTPGTSGTSGTSGTGSSGSSGTSGSSGRTGTSGTSGRSDSGTSGTSGTSGASGTSGVPGSSGTSGTSGYSSNQYVSDFLISDWEPGDPYFTYYIIQKTNLDHGQGERRDLFVYVYQDNGTSITDRQYSKVDLYYYVSENGTITIESGFQFKGYVIIGVVGIGPVGPEGPPHGTSGTSGVSGGQNASEVPLGPAPDASWTDGLITSWTDDTPTSTAIDDINEILMAIAPAPAGDLTSQSLTLTNTTKYSAKLPSGLTAAWYKDGTTAGSIVTDYVVDNAFTLTSPDQTTRFKCGRANNPEGVLSLKRDGVAIDTYDLSGGTGFGTGGMIHVNALNVYNSIWEKANAHADITQSDEGHRGYTFSHTLAGETNVTAIRYDNVNTTPTFSVNPSVVENTPVLKYLSGIAYYGLNTTLFLSFIAASGIFTKGYHPSNVAQITMNPTAIATNNQVPSSTPAYNDTFVISNLNLTLNVSNRSSNSPYLRTTLYKPNGSSFYYDVNLARKVCTYGTISTTTADYFFDEAQRLNLNSGTAWDSTATLSNGNAQVRNGTLQYANSTDYPGFTGNQEYQRWFYKTSASTGSLVFSGIEYADIDAYGTGDLNVLIQLDTNGQFFDLGKVVGNDSGDGTTRELSKGGRSSGSSGTVNWSIGNYTTANNDQRYRIIIIFRNASHSITTITSS